MTDIYDAETRSRIMRRIVARNTSPEIRVRKALHQLGYRFRLHRKDLPGKPDIVLPRWRSVVLVHGCFWHGHKKCCEGHFPKTNTKYWTPKLTMNRRRDVKNLRKLRRMGWIPIVVWECQTGNREKLARRLDEKIQALKPLVTELKASSKWSNHKRRS